MNKKNLITQNIKNISFIFIGIVSIISGLVILWNTVVLPLYKMNTWAKTTGEVVGYEKESSSEIDNSGNSERVDGYIVVIDYKVKDATKEVHLKMNNPPEIGAKYELYYSPKDDQDYILRGVNYLNLLFIMNLIVGMWIIKKSLISIFKNKKDNKINNSLINSGLQAVGKIDRIERSKDGFYQVVVKILMDNGEYHEYKSDKHKTIKNRLNIIGKKVSVYFNKNDYQKYYVDINDIK